MSRHTCEREYDFTLVLSGISVDDEAAEERLFEAGCDDATLSFRSGRPYLTFSREAKSLKDAILSAVGNVKCAGYDVIRTDVCDLVTQSDIARRTGRKRQQISQYRMGIRGPGGFPPPACYITDEKPLWYWCEVADWLHQHDMISEDVSLEAREVAAINSALELQYHKHMAPELLREVICTIATDLDDPCCS